MWNDSTLSLHDRSMVTLSILLGKGLIDASFRSHLEMGKRHGITRREIAALLTQAAFYAGWPNAWAGFRVAKEVWADDDAATERERFQQEMIFPIGEPNTAYAAYFTGSSYLARISTGRIPFANVTFEPRCRNNWHIHHATAGGGQMLVGVAGRGWYQEAGKPAQEILPGTVIQIPAGVKHCTALRPTVGSRTSPSRLRERTSPTSGSNPSRTRSTTDSANRAASYNGAKGFSMRRSAGYSFACERHTKKATNTIRRFFVGGGS